MKMDTNKESLWKSLFCCEEYAKRSSTCCDGKLCIIPRIMHFIHGLICFTCRRFSSQIRTVDGACKKVLEGEISKSCCMSKEAKERIKKELERE